MLVRCAQVVWHWQLAQGGSLVIANFRQGAIALELPVHKPAAPLYLVLASINKANEP